MKLRILEKQKINSTNNKVEWSKFIPQIKKLLFWYTLEKTYGEVETNQGDKKILYTIAPFLGITPMPFESIQCNFLSIAEQELKNYLSQLGLDLIIKYNYVKKIHKYFVGKNNTLIRK